MCPGCPGGTSRRDRNLDSTPAIALPTPGRRRRDGSRLVCLAIACLVGGETIAAGAGAWVLAGPPPLAQPVAQPKAATHTSARDAGERDRDELERRLLLLLNGERAKRGLVPLTRLGALDSAARLNTETMARTRAVRHGMPGNLPRVTVAWRAIGENVGAAESVEQVHRLMMASRRHRDNILQPAFDAVGIAAARGEDGRVYVTEVFIGQAPATAR